MLQCSCFKGGYRLNFWRGAVRPSQATWWRRKRKMAWRSAQRHVKRVFQNMAASEITKILVCYCILVKKVKKVNDEQMAHNPNENWRGKSEGLPAVNHQVTLRKTCEKHLEEYNIYIIYIISCVFITTKIAGLVYDIFPFWWVALYGQLDQLGFVTHHLAFGAKNDQYTAQNIENNENTWSIYSSIYKFKIYNSKTFNI